MCLLALSFCFRRISSHITHFVRKLIELMRVRYFLFIFFTPQTGAHCAALSGWDSLCTIYGIHQEWSLRVMTDWCASTITFDAENFSSLLCCSSQFLWQPWLNSPTLNLQCFTVEIWGKGCDLQVCISIPDSWLRQNMSLLCTSRELKSHENY